MNRPTLNSRQLLFILAAVFAKYHKQLVIRMDDKGWVGALDDAINIRYNMVVLIYDQEAKTLTLLAIPFRYDRKLFAFLQTRVDSVLKTLRMTQDVKTSKKVTNGVVKNGLWRNRLVVKKIVWTGIESHHLLSLL